MKSESLIFRKSPSCMTTSTLSIHSQLAGSIESLVMNLYVMDHTCNHNFINLQFPFVFSHLYFAGHDCSASPSFDVLTSCYFYNDTTMN